MMKITYIQHSGFMAELDRHVLVFDYYKGRLPDFNRDKQMVVFASHGHYDHFQNCIFDWAFEFPDIRYVLSSDIRAGIPSSLSEEKVFSIRAGRRESIGGEEDMTVRTFHSTDLGVAFIVETEGKRLYHAGDLNWWHWEEETDRYNMLMKRAYQREINKMQGLHIDAAFVPLDPRLGEQYYWGMDYFMRHTDTDIVFPMHMQGDYGLYDRLMKEDSSAGYRDKVAHITREGQEFILD